ncbi:MAG: co-chaperone DjlA [Gammaproteobacteria bacterium]|nr:co-chaperone DjlA [Gammaproteobacteria bacterium]NNM01112.1 co-chaperone DjlA [Gammaproteobacteria bacterium]
MGKLIGMLLGWLVLRGWFGALIGLVIGHFFDRGLARNARRLSGAELAEVQDAFFATTFGLLGYLAKADGRVSEEEIARTEEYMRQMGLNSEHRERAKALFRGGRDAGFSVADTLAQFNARAGRYGNLRQLLLTYLIGMALADGRIDDAEDAVLREVAAGLGFGAATFDALLRMVSAQEQFRGFGSGRRTGSRTPPPRTDELALAYQALGVDRSASDGELKRAYRRLMSEYHPDKLMGQGVPEDMIKVATERAQEVQAAYDLIKKSRAGG